MFTKFSAILLVLTLLSLSAVLAESPGSPTSPESFKIGWIGQLSGPLARYGAGQASIIAEDDINAAGGVLGRRLEIIREDGQGKGATAVSAFKKLVAVDHVRFIVGGNCTPESSAIAPLAEQAGVVLRPVVLQ